MNITHWKVLKQTLFQQSSRIHCRRHVCSVSDSNIVSKDLLDSSISLSSREKKLLDLTLTEAVEWLNTKKTTATELVEVCLKQQKRTKNFNAYITVTEDRARKKGKEIDNDSMSQYSKKILCGVPIAVKDMFCVKDVRTTAASKMLKDFVPSYDSTVTERLEAEGAIIIGKTNMDEFSMGSATIFSEFGPTINPWSLTQRNTLYTAGGSSGGSAAALAAKTCFAAIGTDTGGSVRLPASYCGLVGLKPSYGLVSRWGVIAYASSLDTPGIITKTVRDAALMLQVIAGPDDKDSTCLEAKYRPSVDYVVALEQRKDLRGIRIGIPKEYNVAELSDEMRAIWYSGAQWLRQCGATIVKVSLPHTDVALSAYYIIAPAEASSNLARYDGIRFGYRCEEREGDSIRDMYIRTRSAAFGAEVKRRILLGTFVLSRKSYESYYKKALQIRRLVQNDFNNILRPSQDLEASLSTHNDSTTLDTNQISNEDKVDAILTPTAPTPAFPLETAYSNDNPVLLYLNDVMTIPANMAGIPAISVPVGFSKEGLPVGLQLMSAALNETTLLQIAFHLEALAKEHSPFKNQLPL